MPSRLTVVADGYRAGTRTRLAEAFRPCRTNDCAAHCGIETVTETSWRRPTMMASELHQAMHNLMMWLHEVGVFPPMGPMRMM